MKMLILSLVAVAWLGCAHERRFAYRAILWHDPDDQPIPKPPARKNPGINWEGTRDSLFRPANRLFGADYGREAVNVNALDEVPDSTWFVNRRRDRSSPDDQPRWHPLAPEAVERGGVIDEGPVRPIVILHDKTEGSASGLVIRDARGVQYMLKLDPAGYPGLITSIEVVATRLAWAAGWNVPSDTLIDLKLDELKLAPDAWTKNRWGRRIPFTADGLEELLAHVAHNSVLRAVASRWIEGEPIGWFSYYGRDQHDANDRVPHQNRRDLRGFGVWASWVDDVDTFDNNTLDTYLGEPGQGRVIHWQQGVGASFGRFYGRPTEYWMGRQPYFSPGSTLASLTTMGLVPRPWEDRRLVRARAELLSEWPEFGFYDAEHFDPRRWRPVADNPAFVRQTRRDRYWGAKQVVAFTPDELRAAIAAGRYRPEAAEHLFQVLWKRRERIARAFFSDVAPLDRFQLVGDQLCFEDLWITAGLGGDAETRYEARERADGRETLRTVDAARCVSLPLSEGYRIVSLRARRPGDRHFGPTVQVHLVERAGVRHVVGVAR
jgi:hypothetical protein